MSIKIKLFYPDLQRLIDNRDTIMVEGQTVGECLQDLVRRHPEAKELIFNDRGTLIKQVYVYVNAEGMNKADFSRQITPRDELILAVLITGG
jgi:hypothetical protein